MPTKYGCAWEWPGREDDALQPVHMNSRIVIVEAGGRGIRDRPVRYGAVCQLFYSWAVGGPAGCGGYRRKIRGPSVAASLVETVCGVCNDERQLLSPLQGLCFGWRAFSLRVANENKEDLGTCGFGEKENADRWTRRTIRIPVKPLAGRKFARSSCRWFNAEPCWGSYTFSTRTG